MNHGYPIIPDILLCLFIYAVWFKFQEKPPVPPPDEPKKPPKPKSKFWYYRDRHGKVHTEIRQEETWSE